MNLMNQMNPATSRYVKRSSPKCIDSLFQLNPLIAYLKGVSPDAWNDSDDWDDFVDFVRETRAKAGIEDPSWD